MYRFRITATICLLFLIVNLSFGLEKIISDSSLYLRNDSCKRIELKDYLGKLPEIRDLFKKGKQIKTNDSTLEIAFWVALSFYPELKDAKVTMKLRRIPATMSALPQTFYLLKSKANRKYSVNVNNKRDRFGMDYSDLTFNALVGWIGHELGHIGYYTKSNNCELTGFIFKYVVSSRYRREAERSTDLEAIQHNLGYSLLEGCQYLLNNPVVSEKYKEKHRKFYMLPDEIVESIKNK